MTIYMDTDYNGIGAAHAQDDLLFAFNVQTFSIASYPYSKELLTLNPIDAAISNFVWYDHNRNGIQDDGKPGIDGVVVHLLDSTGAQIATTATADGGWYRFEGLAAGDYQIEFILPSEFEGFALQNQGDDDIQDSDVDPVNGKTAVITLATDEHNITIDAGLVSKQYSLDIDADGIVQVATDGVLLLRRMLGFEGAALIDGVFLDMSALPPRNIPSDIAAYIDASLAAGVWDFDRDGLTLVSSDGILILRRMFGFEGSPLVDNALTPGATHTNPAEIAVYIDQLITPVAASMSMATMNAAMASTSSSLTSTLNSWRSGQAVLQVVDDAENDESSAIESAAASGFELAVV